MSHLGDYWGDCINPPKTLTHIDIFLDKNFDMVSHYIKHEL